jgi:hypothetical protein
MAAYYRSHPFVARHDPLLSDTVDVLNSDEATVDHVNHPERPCTQTVIVASMERLRRVRIGS